LVSLIQKAKLIIWDEAPMMHNHCFEAVDWTLKNILKSVDKKNKNIPFGGKVVVLGGDFKLLTVIPKSTKVFNYQKKGKSYH
jgi:ATP-dependent DNA helicase PIF1